MVVDRDNLRQLEQIVMLAPLHQSHNLNACFSGLPGHRHGMQEYAENTIFSQHIALTH
jgi:acetate kinase